MNYTKKFEIELHKSVNDLFIKNKHLKYNLNLELASGDNAYISRNYIHIHRHYADIPNINGVIVCGTEGILITDMGDTEDGLTSCAFNTLDYLGGAFMPFFDKDFVKYTGVRFVEIGTFLAKKTYIVKLIC